MSCTNDLLAGMGGWLNAVAGRFAPPRNKYRAGYLSRDDFYQEAALAILTAQPQEEWLAKTIALRAMTKYRKRHDLVRAVKGDRMRARVELDDVSGEPEPSGVFWDNLSDCLTPEQARTVRAWAESGATVAEIGEAEGVSVGAVNQRLQSAFRKIRLKWGKRHDGR